MRKIESVVLGVTLGAVPIIASFLTGWWVSIPFAPESSIWRYALGGLLFGLFVDAIFLGRWIRRAYSMKTWVWMAVYGFYSIGVLGGFMGMPVFNLLLAVPAGAFVGRWLAHGGADSARMQRTAQRTAAFTATVLALVCLTSGSIALTAHSTASDLQGMLALPFEVTHSMIVGIIVVGGAVMLVLDWWLTIGCVKCVYGYFIAHDKSPSGLTSRRSPYEGCQ